MPFLTHTTPIEGLLVIEPKVFVDERGLFMESFKASDFARFGVTQNFVQDNHSKSKKGVIRGLHFQRAPHAQGKLVRVTHGRAWDVAVDLRKGSSTFGMWYAEVLSADNHLLFWIPEGFAHGFLALEDDTELLYKCTTEYNQPSDGGIRWNDPDINVQWPEIGVSPILSAKDADLPLLKDCIL
jgi:dTDP-4-dehydrorhamnose 3,5-epimerase